MLLTAFALFPVALRLHQAGHEIEGPMAIVILGGLVSSTLVSLLIFALGGSLAAKIKTPRRNGEGLCQGIAAFWEMPRC